MLKLIKWIGSTMLALVLILVVAAVVIKSTVDPNDYRDELTALVKQKTGRDLALDGDLSISVFPWLGIRTEGLRFSQPSAIGGDMLAVKTAQLRVKFMPLLKKRVEVDTIVLESPHFRLVTLANGTDSFAGLMDETGSEPKPADPAAAVALVVQGVRITDGSIRLEDRAAGTSTDITQLSLATGNLLGDSLADLNLSGQLSQSGDPEATQFDLGARARVDTETLAAQLERLNGKITKGEHVIHFETDAIAVSPAQNITLIGLSVNLAGAHTLDVSIPDANLTLAEQRLEAPAVLVSINNLSAEIERLRVVDLMDSPSASGALSVPSFDATALLKSMKIDYQPSNADALKKVSLAADFSANTNSAALKQLQLKLDQSTLAGSASITNFAAPAIKFDLSLDQLNIDEYLPPSTENTEQVSGGEALAVPLAMFEAVNANGRFKANRLVVGGIQLEQIDVRVASTDGQVEIVPTAALYEGKLAGNIQYTQQGDQARLSVKQKMDLVQLGKLLMDAEVTEQLQGLGDLDVDINVTEQNGVQHNQGVIKILAEQGELVGVDMLRILSQANNVATMLRQGDERQAETAAETEVQAGEQDVTKFGRLSGTFNLNDFLLTNNDLRLTAPGFELNGNGSVDLAAQTLDFTVRVAVNEGVQGELGRQLAKVQGYTIPVRCKGALAAPSCLPDVSGLFSSYAKSKLDEKKGEYLKEKYGIEGGEKMSTQEAIMQALLNKQKQKNQAANGAESASPAESTNPAEPQAPKGNVERPIGERGAEPEAEPAEPALTPKQQRREERRKLLESLLNPDAGND
ncbi:cell envelope biogenesis protein AsmA [Arenicella chitinivorans]|uniref:Cell envelope biogenesis protein AsmA n=1 Tax=Arenicella chitinivorans TaxID=1329800 RepID=A0A918VNH8_9GAMM|nr:AsmA family protein [Arenicella chitinivorans]GHA12533.1 cell envelope biogenesis protein AsmA [Arenicella chitinivorans]